MISLIEAIYRFLFAREAFYKMNALLHLLSLNGMGVLNWRSRSISGEDYFLRKVLRGKINPVVIDVGAHSGDYIRAICAICPEAEVFAFEPHPKTFLALTSLPWTPNVRLINSALGSSEDSLILYDYENDDGSEHASLLPDVIEKIHGSQAVRHVVKVTTLDSFLSSQKINYIDFLKIDTEGNELEVLKGASALLERHAIRAIQFEFNSMNTISRSFMSDFIALLPGYDLFRLLPNGMVKICNYDARLHEIFAFQNIVAIYSAV